MAAPLRRLSSRAVGWLADRRLPRALRAPIFRAFSAWCGIDLAELRLPLAEHPSFGAFFVRRLRPGARPFPDDPAALPSPADGTLQAVDAVEGGLLLQAKGRRYAVAELLGEDAAELEGGTAWTIYLSPRDYHRVHAPCDCTLERVRWIGGDRRAVKPAVLARRERVLATNERAVLRLATPRGPLYLVMVGALNVGRIRVVGLASGEQAAGGRAFARGGGRAFARGGGRAFARGDELARFELGSTVVLIAPPTGPRPAGVRPGASVRLGAPIGRWP